MPTFDYRIASYAIFIVIGTSIDSYKERRKKSRITSDFKSLKTYEYTRMHDAIFDRYNQDGPLA